MAPEHIPDVKTCLIHIFAELSILKQLTLTKKKNKSHHANHSELSLSHTLSLPQ